MIIEDFFDLKQDPEILKRTYKQGGYFWPVKNNESAKGPGLFSMTKRLLSNGSKIVKKNWRVFMTIGFTGVALYALFP